jgi:hypothetical protein
MGFSASNGSSSYGQQAARQARPCWAEANERVGGALSTTYSALDRLVEAGILRPLTDRRRNQVWGVVALLDELDDLGMRIAVRVSANG